MAVALVVIMMMLAVIMLTYRKRIYSGLKQRQMISKLPKVPRVALPLIGHSYLFGGEPAEFFHFIIDLTKKLIEDTKVKVSIIWLGPIPLLFVTHPKSAEVILRSSKHMEKSFVYTFLHPWLGTGLLTSAGEKWKQRRRLITPSFHYNILQDFVEVMNDQARIMQDKIRSKTEEGGEVNIGRMVTMCALDIICETAMGQAVNAQEDYDSTYVKALYRMSELIQLRQKTPIFWWDYGFKKMKLGVEHDQVLHTLHSFTKDVIQERMKTKATKTVSKRMAFLDVLIHAKTEDGKELSLEDIQEEVDTFMFEGHDTTAAAMTWAIYLIGRHPDVQRRIHEELDEVFGNDNERSASMDDLKKLQYLEQTIKESLRLFPSVPLMARVTTEDCEIDGYKVPKNTEVAIFVYQIHHNPHVWEDPERFDPDRFTTENCAGRHPYAYIPFSAGPRNCIGQRFALLEEKVILSHLLRRYSVTSHDKREDIKMVGDLILRPAFPLNITLAERPC